MTHFDNIEYLKTGTERQQQAYQVLKAHAVFAQLADFDPILTGTIPISVDIEGSDLDISCCWDDQAHFVRTLTDCFGSKAHFQLIITEISDIPTVIASFILGSFEVEVFGQPIPTRQQSAYRHMLIEHSLLVRRGETFRQQIIALKRQGHKTEPAFGLVLGLKGDPYQELLSINID